MKNTSIALIALALSACAVVETRQAPAPGIIETDALGAPGYQHGIDKSRFIGGKDFRSTSEFGFIKLVGSEGTFAVNALNGAVVALQNANSEAQRKEVWYSAGHEEHSKAVVAYFVDAGIPRGQIRGVEATTSMEVSGPTNGVAREERSRIRGWQSVIQRSVEGFPVVDSIAWARLNDGAKVMAEWVYWPAIPGRILEDARRFRERLSNDAGRAAYISKLPAELRQGQLVIRHASAVHTGPFEAMVSYDVVEQRSAVHDDGRAVQTRVAVVRHFDAEGREFNLPHERDNLSVR